MYVQTTAATKINGVAIATGAVLAIPRDFYQPAVMSRLGPNLSSGQLAALVPWLTTCPASPLLVFVE
jgi:hypothetical protein